MTICQILAKELNIPEDRVEKTVALIDEGNTIPFIARYRKEVTGSLDDTVLRKLEERLQYLRNIEARREEVKNLIAAQEKLTPEISNAIDNAKTITEIDDIYRPFRPKRKTRASVARDRGLAPLAEALMAQEKAIRPRWKKWPTRWWIRKRSEHAGGGFRGGHGHSCGRYFRQRRLP